MDYGLLQGLAEGIKSGMASYKDVKQMQAEREKEKRDYEQKGLLAQNAGAIDAAKAGKIATYDDQGRVQLASDPDYFKQKALEAREKNKNPLAQAIMTQKYDDMVRHAAEEKEKAAFAKTPEGKVKGLSTESKARLDNARMGLDAVRAMGNALIGEGQNTFTLVGDNDYTMANRQFEEAIGRMQSGGAISADEGKRFRAMAPTWRDSKESQRKKITRLQEELLDRIKTLGLSEEELGDAGYSVSKFSPKTQEKLGGLVKPQGLVNAPYSQDDIKKYAKDNGISEEQAKSIIDSRLNKTQKVAR